MVTVNVEEQLIITPTCGVTNNWCGRIGARPASVAVGKHIMLQPAGRIQYPIARSFAANATQEQVHMAGLKKEKKVLKIYSPQGLHYGIA